MIIIRFNQLILEQKEFIHRNQSIVRQGKIQNNSSQQFWIQGSKFRRRFQSRVHDVSITKIRVLF